MNDWIELIRNQILEDLDAEKDVSDEVLRDAIQRHIKSFSEKHLLTLEQRQRIQVQLFNSFRKLDVLQELLEQQDVTEIMVNGHKNIFYEKKGALHRWDKVFSSEDMLENVVRQIAALGNKSISEAEPIVDTRLSDGSRVNIVAPPASVEGYCVTVRKFGRSYMSLGKLVEMGTISQELKQFLELIVRAGYNIFVSGGTGSGKTTFLNALSMAIPDGERVITIEDSAELQLQGVENLVRLEAREANLNGASSITIRDLIRTSLRMRPDRIIVGEVRGPEAIELLQANNTGHSGSMSTGHGNSCRDMLSRLEILVLMGLEIPLQAVRSQISSGIDILIHMGRLENKSRKVLQVCEILGMTEGQIDIRPLYEYDQGERTWERKGRLTRMHRITEKGFGKELEKLYGQQELYEAVESRKP